METPRLLIVTLGGTIAMTAAKSGGATPTLTGKDLLSSVPGLEDVAQIDVVSPLQIPGASLTLPDLGCIALLIDKRVREDGYTGVVVVQGTDTIEETAFVLDCLVSVERPVVITGAMRIPSMAGAEGPANLLSSCVVAATADAGLGVVAVLNDEVHAARLVRKSHTGLPSAFSSAPGGPLGHVVEGRYQPLTRPFETKVKFPDLAKRLATAEIPPVALITVGLGDSGVLLSSLDTVPVAGAVIAGMGVGHVPADMAAPLGVLASRMPVILTSRIGIGPTYRETYGFPGSEIDLLSRGLVPGGAIGPFKARLLLQMLLVSGRDLREVRNAFEEL